MSVLTTKDITQPFSETLTLARVAKEYVLEAMMGLQHNIERGKQFESEDYKASVHNDELKAFILESFSWHEVTKRFSRDVTPTGQ